MSKINRRDFLAGGIAATAGWGAASLASAKGGGRGKRPVAISSGNGLRAVARAVTGMKSGEDPLDAIVQGVGIVEDDPNDMSVGYGGLPNERGVVELDASVMHGALHKAGAVAALQRIKNPAQVARKVCLETDHVMLVGAGALDFARAQGFKEQDLLTEKARKAWLRWKRNLNPGDDWLDDDQRLGLPARSGEGAKQERRRTEAIPFTYGTIHCSGLDAAGNLAACTTTSGLSYKIPGRVGDSPIIGAGLFVDDEVGSAGATGRGEAVIQSSGAFQVVQNMARGSEPTKACLEALEWIARHTRRPYLLDEKGRPNFNVVFYAVRKDGLYGSAAMWEGRSFTVDDGEGPRTERCAFLFSTS